MSDALSEDIRLGDNLKEDMEKADKEATKIAEYYKRLIDELFTSGKFSEGKSYAKAIETAMADTRNTINELADERIPLGVPDYRINEENPLDLSEGALATLEVIASKLHEIGKRNGLTSVDPPHRQYFTPPQR